MQQKYDVKFIKTALDKDREKFLFLRLVNTQYVIAQIIRVFYHRINNRNIRIFIRIYHKKTSYLFDNWS